MITQSLQSNIIRVGKDYLPYKLRVIKKQKGIGEKMKNQNKNQNKKASVTLRENMNKNLIKIMVEYTPEKYQNQLNQLLDMRVSDFKRLIGFKIDYIKPLKTLKNPKLIQTELKTQYNLDFKEIDRIPILIDMFLIKSYVFKTENQIRSFKGFVIHKLVNPKYYYNVKKDWLECVTGYKTGVFQSGTKVKIDEGKAEGYQINISRLDELIDMIRGENL